MGSKVVMNERQRKFVEHYMGEAAGNATKAAELSGYKQHSETGWRLIRNPKVVKAIVDRIREDPIAATREDRIRFFSRVMLGLEGATMHERLRAGELLCRMSGDFLETVQIQGTVEHVDRRAQLRDLIEGIEAEPPN